VPFAGHIQALGRLPRPRRGALIPLGLAALCFALAFLQRPGLAYDDTRIELSADPGLFLHRVSSLWSSTFDLGHVQSGQFVGYLFPMAPFFALAHWLAIPTWVAQRLWLGMLLSLAAWGAVRLFEQLFEPRRGPAHIAAGVVYAINPYVVIYVSRGSVTLLALAALPWLLLATHRGLDVPTGWRWPAFCGLVLAAAGGGVNAAVLAWIALAPLALLAYELFVLGRGRGAVWSFGWRAALCVVLGSAWWVVPIALQAGYGSDFLRFTEQPKDIFATTSMSESVRLLGYWVSYFSFGVGEVQPTVAAIGTYLHRKPVVIASFLIPLTAFGGLVWTRRYTYAPFFGLLAVAALLVMAAGFPLSAPLSHALTDLYYHLSPVQFLRTTYKAAPLLAISIACLTGAAVGMLTERARSGDLRLLGSRVPAWTLPALAVVPVLWAAPLFAGHAIDRPLAYDHVPRSWKAAMTAAQRTTPADRRLMVLPGELFGWYRWGGTWTSIAPALDHRPVLIREISRYADPRASQLQDVVDDQVGQLRLVPGELPSLMELMGVGQVLVANDSSRVRSGALDSARLADGLAGEPGFERPLAVYGSVRSYAPDPSFGGAPIRVADLEAYAGPGASGPGVVRVAPTTGSVVLDGDAAGIVELAASGGLDPGRNLAYAADLQPAALRDRVRQGAELVFTDSNRRREVVGSELYANHGVTLEASDPLPREQATYNLFPGAGTDAQSVAVYTGVRYLRSPESPAFGVFPANRAYAAFDGRLNTAWIANAQSPADRYVELALPAPRRLQAILVHPHDDATGRVAEIGVTINGGVEHRVGLVAGWNRVALLGARVSTLRLRIVHVAGGVFPASGGLDEVRVPGLQVHESIRLPVRLANATRGLALGANAISVITQRETADFPRRPRALSNDLQPESQANMADPETAIDRELRLPVARTFTLDGWASVSPQAPDHLLDLLTGLRSTTQFDSSGRFEGVPANRASAAFDGSTATAWVAPLAGHRPQPWIEWRALAPVSLSSLRLVPGPPEYRFPTVVRVTTEQSPGEIAVVRPDGTVILRRPLRGRHVRIAVLASASPTQHALHRRHLAAVAIGEVVVGGSRGPAARRPARGSFATGCGEINVSIGGATTAARVTGTVVDLDAGRPLRISGCAPLAVPAGDTYLRSGPGTIMRADLLRLYSPATAPLGAAATQAPAVLASGHGQDGRRDGVRLALHGPTWLVLAESYSRGWRAWCTDARGRESALGSPQPVDGYANGWQVGSNCVAARFRFAPQALATASYWLTILAALIVAGGLAAGLRTRRPGRARAIVPAHALIRPGAGADSLLRLPWLSSLALAALALLIGGLEAWRVGAILAVITIGLAREGASVVRLLALAAIGFAALPAMYILKAPPKNLGEAFSFSFPAQLLSAHWVAAVAVLCLGAGIALDAWRMRAER
jgi:arabinofuranan 3-O-arabinosyltransferase